MPCDEGVQVTVRRLNGGADVETPAVALFGSEHKSPGDITNVDIVAGICTSPENLRGTARQQCLREDGHDPCLTVGILAWPVHVGRGDETRLQPIKVAVHVQVQLAGHLRRSIG